MLTTSINGLIFIDHTTLGENGFCKFYEVVKRNKNYIVKIVYFKNLQLFESFYTLLSFFINLPTSK